MRQALLRGQELGTVIARVAGKFGEAGLHAVDACLDHACRMGDAFGLAIDHPHDLAHFTNGVAERAETGLRGATALDAGLDLGRDCARLASKFSERRTDL